MKGGASTSRSINIGKPSIIKQQPSSTAYFGGGANNYSSNILGIIGQSNERPANARNSQIHNRLIAKDKSSFILQCGNSD
jgi:hypothetical protein